MPWRSGRSQAASRRPRDRRRPPASRCWAAYYGDRVIRHQPGHASGHRWPRLLTEAENIAISAGFTPLGDNDPVRQGLKHRIEERVCAAEIDGVRGLAETLHDLLGEKGALAAINRSAPCTWQIDELAGGLYRVAMYRDDSMIDRRDTTGEGIGQAKAAMLTDLAHTDTH